MLFISLRSPCSMTSADSSRDLLVFDAFRRSEHVHSCTRLLRPAIAFHRSAAAEPEDPLGATTTLTEHAVGYRKRALSLHDQSRPHSLSRDRMR